MEAGQSSANVALAPEIEPIREAGAHHGTATAEKRVIKVLVWDLDETIWEGTLLEGDVVRVRPGVRETLATLDRRGILHSIASKNDPAAAMGKLSELGLADYFLYPQIGWSAKSVGVRQIAQSINIGLDTVAFVDDQPFEREEVRHSLPEVMTLDVSDLAGVTERPEFMPRFITDESSIRRQMYLADIERNQAEQEFVGPQEDFLAGLEMNLTIAPAREEDLKRAEELTQRTHQLNTTGYTYSYDELNAFRESPQHLLLVADLVDRFGTYGKIGLALTEKQPTLWNIKLLLMSCRVMSRGVGTILMNHLLSEARDADVRLVAELKPNDRNRMMQVTYRFAGFKEVGQRDGVSILEHDLQAIPPFPGYLEVCIRKA